MKEEIRARLTIKDFQSMSKKQKTFMLKWLKAIQLELENAKAEDYSKNPRWTLFN